MNNSSNGGSRNIYSFKYLLNIKMAKAGLPLLINTSFWNLYVFCSIWWISQTFSVHRLYVLGLERNNWIVICLIAAVSSICISYFLALPSTPSGIKSKIAILGSSVKLLLRVSNTFFQNYRNSGQDQNTWVWLVSNICLNLLSSYWPQSLVCGGILWLPSIFKLVTRCASVHISSQESCDRFVLTSAYRFLSTTVALVLF